MGLRGNRLLYAVAGFASLGQFLFGYDQGVMSGVLVDPRWLQTMHHPSEAMQGQIVGVFLLAAWVTAYVASYAMEAWGRRGTIQLGSLIFAVGGIVQAASQTVAVLAIGRAITGVGIGFLSTALPVYTTELARAANRGRVTIMGMSINMLGYAASVFVDYGCSYGSSDWMTWRLPLLLQSVFAVILFLGSVFLPESPRWLVAHGRADAGARVIARLFDLPPSEPPVVAEVRHIQADADRMAALATPSWREMLVHYRHRSFIAVAVQTLGQMSGVNCVTYFAPKMYATAGIVGHQALLLSAVTGLVYFAGAVVAIFVVDVLGRRPVFMTGSLLMAVWLTALAIFVKIGTPAVSWFVIAFMMLFMFTFGASWACLDWLYPAEIFNLRVRSKGMALAVGANWLSNYAIASITPPMLVHLGWVTYLFYAAWNLVAIGVVFLSFPETRGCSLETIDDLFSDGQRPSRDARSSAYAPLENPLHDASMSRVTLDGLALAGDLADHHDDDDAYAAKMHQRREPARTTLLPTPKKE
ncbi:hypothetical protein CXG81DRAFT_16964 [Caulochytrium protostelioides]|uniref:Major facilitator superfamily (MFS) profile domain-containing protein n=1 Tax=Caulochytrium protostelioides TaxID=1555241 RepID=A0A4P9XDQ0_9FUNG|nr:hypothetical protein CXG81DRAFT_16964 [Caulochytrium protostelioides]|eukprot:RKP03592.1 hypothetical protein CXG81DRAFT_16964 [Caulochytrium protostelioides]